MMRNKCLCIAAMATMLFCVGTVDAALLYDMEGASPPSGFGPNGFPAPVITQDTIGATEGTNSMKYFIPDNATFVGALTPVVPVALGNPPGVQSILFDMTIDTGEEFAGAFADIGVVVFGFQGGSFGLQHQFTDLEAIGGKAAGIYKDVQIDLSTSIQSGGKSFNQILADGDLDGVTGFQLYVGKSADAPVTVYIDNIRSVVPEPATGLLLSLGALGLGFIRRK